jgi:glutamate synthase (ferredoxin)
VNLEKLTAADEIEEVRQLIARHADYTKSTRARKVLAEWDRHVPQFVKIIPKDYQRVLEAIQRAQAAGLSGDDAVTAAFEQNIRDTARVGGN